MSCCGVTDGIELESSVSSVRYESIGVILRSCESVLRVVEMASMISRCLARLRADFLCMVKYRVKVCDNIKRVCFGGVIKAQLQVVLLGVFLRFC